MPRSSEIRRRFISTGNDGIEYRDTFWDDMRFPAFRQRQGASQKPDFDYTEVGLLFPQNDATEIAYITDQMPHRWKHGTAIKPHLHYVQDESAEPVFKVDYRVYENAADPTGSFTTLTSSNFVLPYSSGSILQIVSFPAIDMSTIDSLSAFFDFKLYRDDDVVTGDVLLKGFDIHYQIDRPGSRTEYSK